MLEKFLSQINKINEKVDLDNEFPDWNKSVQFNVSDADDGAFYFVARDGKIAEVSKGWFKDPDVTIEGTGEAMNALFDGQCTITGAFIMKELNIKGAISDALGAKVLIEAVRVF